MWNDIGSRIERGSTIYEKAMYKTHPLLSTPQDTEKLWRYMDLSQFIHLLDAGSLYFAKVQEFNDRWEGQIPYSMHDAIRSSPIYQSIIAHLSQDDAFKLTKSFTESELHYYGVSCWHWNEVESIAMWKLYTSGKDGVAIQSTVGKLKEAFSHESRDLYIAEVQYNDHELRNIPESSETHALIPIITKRRSFRHEREVRIILDRRPSDATPEYEWGMRFGFLGEPVEINYAKVIERIVVAESFPKWAIQSLQDQVNWKGLGIDVEESDLLKIPATDTIDTET